MADWPDTEELKLILDLKDDPADWTQTLDRVLNSAIAYVKSEIGDWNEDTDAPTDNQAQAALRMAELMALRPQSSAQAGSKDPAYQRLMYGQHRRFGIS